MEMVYTISLLILYQLKLHTQCLGSNIDTV